MQVITIHNPTDVKVSQALRVCGFASPVTTAEAIKNLVPIRESGRLCVDNGTIEWGHCYNDRNQSQLYISISR